MSVYTCDSQDDWDVFAPGDRQELRELGAQGLPDAFLLIVPREPVVYRGRVEDYDTHFERAFSELACLVNVLLLVIESVWFEEQYVLHDLLIGFARHLFQPLQRDALGVDVHDFLAREGDVSRDLKADVSLAAARFSEKKRDGSTFEAPFQEIV